MEPESHFIGYIDELDDTTVWATLYDEDGVIDSVCEFLRTTFGEKGSLALYEGAVFDWYIRPPADSRIVVRPPEYWTQEQLDAIHKRAGQLQQDFNDRVILKDDQETTL